MRITDTATFVPAVRAATANIGLSTLEQKQQRCIDMLLGTLVEVAYKRNSFTELEIDAMIKYAIARARVVLS